MRSCLEPDCLQIAGLWLPVICLDNKHATLSRHLRNFLVHSLSDSYLVMSHYLSMKALLLLLCQPSGASTGRINLKYNIVDLIVTVVIALCSSFDKDCTVVLFIVPECGLELHVGVVQ